jgi:hypothetical protein
MVQVIIKDSKANSENPTHTDFIGVIPEPKILPGQPHFTLNKCGWGRAWATKNTITIKLKS